MTYNQTSLEKSLEKLDRIIRYMDLKLAQWKIEDQLNREYPGEMYKSMKKIAQTMLKSGVIKCRHE